MAIRYTRGAPKVLETSGFALESVQKGLILHENDHYLPKKGDFKAYFALKHLFFTENHEKNVILRKKT